MSRHQGTSLRSICSRTLRHTSAHGVPNIIHSQDRWRSCCWAAFVLLVLSCMLWQCSQLTATYLKYPTQEKVTLVNSARLPFPAVTFCNLNRARTSQLNLSKYDFLKDYLPHPLEHEFDDGLHSHANERQFAFALSQLSTHDQMELGHQLKDMLISCIFHDEVCNESYFTPFLNPKLGNCYTFNGPKHPSLTNRQTDVLNCTKAGFSYGLTMELFIEQNEYINTLSTAAGLRVVLHGQEKMPFPEDEGVNVPPGQESDIGVVKCNEECPDLFIGETKQQLHQWMAQHRRSKPSDQDLVVYLHLKEKSHFFQDSHVRILDREEDWFKRGVKVHVKRLQEPYSSQCSSGQDIRNYYADVYGTDYSREACKKSCAQIKMIKNCGCRMWEFPAPLGSDVPLCNISEPSVNHCVELYEYKLSHDQLKCHCPLQCQEENFELTLSSSQWPSSTYLDYYSNHIRSRHGYQDVQNIRDNVVKVVVYYQQLNYELIEEVPSMQLVDLFSSIGGLVGLWIGVSVCTVAEFLELILIILTFVIGRIPKREDTPENPYSIPKPQSDAYSPVLSGDHCLLWDPLDDFTSLLKNNSEDSQSLQNPYLSYETINDCIFNA